MKASGKKLKFFCVWHHMYHMNTLYPYFARVVYDLSLGISDIWQAHIYGILPRQKALYLLH